MSSILEDVKHKIGPSAEYEYFEKDIIDAINSAFATLNQIGAGPDDGFEIQDASTQWEEYTTSKVLLGFIRTYVCDKVRLIFDTPNSSYLIQEIKDRIDEYAFRIQCEVDPKGGE